jgi:hypothetical protein
MSLPGVLFRDGLPGEATLGGERTFVLRFLVTIGLSGDEGCSRSSFRSFCRDKLVLEKKKHARLNGQGTSLMFTSFSWPDVSTNMSEMSPSLFLE